MTFAPFLNAPLPIQIHLVTALVAIGLTIAILTRRKGTETHKWLGRVWIGFMTAVTLSSFLIYELRIIGPLSLIHLLSALTLASLVIGWRYARQRNIKQHARVMKAVVFGGLLIAGLFTLLPGRTMHAILFGA